MIELIRNEETRIIEAWESGKKIGEIFTMDMDIKNEDQEVT